MTSFEVLPYRRAEHEQFVMDTFLGSVEECWPWSDMGREKLRFNFGARLRRAHIRAAVAHVPGDPKELMGWAAVSHMDNEVVYAYTKASYRTSKDGRYAPRVATSLISGLGVDLSKPTVVRYWTLCARAIAAKPAYRIEPPRDCG